MPKNDEGEFELVLGNKQLISVFVIVVVLLGVFFSMGYIVGRNSSGVTDTAKNEKPKADREADSTDTTPAPGDDTTAPALDSAKPADADATPAESTRPAEEPAAKPAKSEPARSKEVAPREATKEVKPKPSPAPPPAAKPSAAPVHAAAAGEPASGQYWQVMATARPDAEIIAEALGKKGFHVVLAPAPTEGIFRVLVGPLPDAPTQASTRTNLEAAGFKNPIIRKY